MKVLKRSGELEEFNLDKLVAAITWSTEGYIPLLHVDCRRIAEGVLSGLYDGVPTQDIDRAVIDRVATMIIEHPEYAQLGGRLMLEYIKKEAASQGVIYFRDFLEEASTYGIIEDDWIPTYDHYRAEYQASINRLSHHFYNKCEYFGVKTLYDRYLIRNPLTNKVIETPEMLFQRVAMFLSTRPGVDYIKLFEQMITFRFIPSTPTLFNSMLKRPQLSSCYLLDLPKDSIDGIYDMYKDIAKLSKYSGGIGLSVTSIRGEGAHIRGTNGRSSGIIPFLKTLDSSVAAVNQGGRRKGAAAVYLEPWHVDIEAFLELRDNTGDEARRTHNLNLALWMSDNFMEAVEADGDWYLFDPASPTGEKLLSTWGPAFEASYNEGVEKRAYRKVIKARHLYERMLRTLAQTGNGWMCFKDTANRLSPQIADKSGGAGKYGIITSSNLCTEILEVRGNDMGEGIAVCNLGSINLGAFSGLNSLELADALAETSRIATRALDAVIDLNFYPTETAKNANKFWRPIGLGVMGLADYIFQNKLSFGEFSGRSLLSIIDYASTMESERMAFEDGDPPFITHGALEFAVPRKNSLRIAIAPTATIASIVGCYECIEPPVSNLFKRETLSGEFIQVNKYLVRELIDLGLWTPEVRAALIEANGSIQGITVIPSELRYRYRTAWEIPQKDLILAAVERQIFIDQSQSLNLFIESPSIGVLSSMYMFAWKRNLKTTYYLRSRPATSIKKTVVAAPQEAIACSLENPEACESCQ